MSHHRKSLTTISLETTNADVSAKIGCQPLPEPGAARPHPGVAGRRQPGQANALRPSQASRQVVDRALTNQRICRRQVDQIRRVSKVRADLRVADQSAVLLDLFVGMPGQLLALRRAQKDLHALGVKRLRPRNARREPARG